MSDKSERDRVRRILTGQSDTLKERAERAARQRATIQRLGAPDGRLEAYDEGDAMLMIADLLLDRIEAVEAKLSQVEGDEA